MNLEEAREALATAVSTLTDVTCTPRPVPGNTRPGDAWVTVGRATPGQFFGTTNQVLSAFVVLGSDRVKADAQIDVLTVPLLQCVYPLYGAAAFVEPQLITAGEDVPSNLYSLALSVTLELSA